MQTQDVVTLSRSLLNDPASTGRWSDATLINFYNVASQEVIRDVEFPESRITGVTVANQQEYPTPELIAVYRVYVAGQLLVPTTLQVLEGHQSMDYDQHALSGFPGTATQTPGSGGPPGTTGPYSPSWNVTPPVAYPFANSWGAPVPDAQIWAPGQRPRYYFRGGSIGLVPAPAGVYDIVIECLRVPSQSLNLTDASIFPSNFKQALAWKVCELAKFSDDGDRASESRNYATQRYEACVRKLRADRKRYDGDAPRGPKMFTYRRSYQKGVNKAGGWIYGD